MSQPRSFLRPSAPDSREVPDDAVLTQYGRRTTGQPTFRSAPRFPAESELSMLWGEMPPLMAALAVRGRIGDDNDRARACRAGGLRAAGFIVTNTPTKRNPDHISVSVPGGAVKWDDGSVKLFEEVMHAGWEVIG
jgi:hypothetical protein